MVKVYVLNVAEFLPMVETARAMSGCRVSELQGDYYTIEADSEIVFNRKDMQMKPAVWYGIFTGGLTAKLPNLAAMKCALWAPIKGFRRCQ